MKKISLHLKLAFILTVSAVKVSLAENTTAKRLTGLSNAFGNGVNILKIMDLENQDKVSKKLISQLSSHKKNRE